MKKFSETKEVEVFDWNKALSKDCKDMSKNEIGNMPVLSRSWVTCACGNQCAIIPRANTGEPIDSILKTIGTAFHDEGILRMYSEFLAEDYERANHFRKEAIEFLRQIEERSAVLIQEEITKSISTIEALGYTVTKNK